LQWSNDMLTVAAHHTDTRERVRETIADLQARNRG
jgi:hypothetical protein